MYIWFYTCWLILFVEILKLSGKSLAIFYVKNSTDFSLSFWNFKEIIYNISMEKNKTKQKQKPTDISKFKRQYFDFYDDIKDYTNGREDW